MNESNGGTEGKHEPRFFDLLFAFVSLFRLIQSAFSLVQSMLKITRTLALTAI